MVNPLKYSIGTKVRESIYLEMFGESVIRSRILDAGCGVGYFTDFFASKGADCVGIDVDNLCIEYCKKNMRGKYLVVDLTKPPYPFADGYFDKIICSEVLEHIEDVSAVLSELKRVVRPYGILVVSAPCSEGIFGSFFKNFGHKNSGYEYHIHEGFSRKQMFDLLINNSFDPIEYRYTMVIGVEIFMALTKLFADWKHGKIDSQSNILAMENDNIWRVYKNLFPIIMLEAKLEQPLSRILKGHMLIIKAVSV